MLLTENPGEGREGAVSGKRRLLETPGTQELLEKEVRAGDVLYALGSDEMS